MLLMVTSVTSLAWVKGPFSASCHQLSLKKQRFVDIIEEETLAGGYIRLYPTDIIYF
jgi:hypothetical protein